MHRALALLAAAAIASATVGGRHAPDGAEIQCDLPAELQMHNCGGSDGAGLCVFTSLAHSAIYQGVPQLADFRDWMRRFPGGGYPAKVEKMIARKCREAGVPEPTYLQVEGLDLDLLREACRAGRMPGITYSYSPTGRYGGQHIAHMVNLVHADEHNFGILDNNYPCSAERPDNYEWMDEKTFKRVHVPGGAWSVILLESGPPPPPHN